MSQNRNSSIGKKAVYCCTFFLTALFLNFFSTAISQAQDAVSSGKIVGDKPLTSDYSRSCLTFLLLEPGRSSTHQRFRKVVNELEVPDKYDDNNISKRFIEISAYERDPQMLLMQQSQNRKIVSGSGLETVYNTLRKERIANQVIAKWWSRKPDGTFGVELLQERGAYDATDAEVIAALAGKRGMARIMDAGEQLINKSYILVFDFHDTKTMDQYYNEVDKKRRETAKLLETSFTPIERTHEGYRTDIDAHLFRIDFNDSVSAVFYQELWIDPSNDDKQTWDKKMMKFDNFDFPVSYVTSVTTTQQSAQRKNATYGKKTDDQLFAGLVTDGFEDVLFQLSTRYEDFRVRTAIFDTRPISAKIGLKEGVSVDQRYFVYEYRLNADGEIEPVRKGVVRAGRRITDNRHVATGQTQPSRFYQVAGRRIQPGMLIEQRNDLGLGISMGYGIEPAVIGSGFWVMAELNISQALGRTGSTPVPGIKLYVDAAFDGIDDSSLPVSVMSVSGGLSKDLYFLRNVHLTPFIGVGFESISASDDGEINASGDWKPINDKDELLYIIYGSAGVRLGINIRHNIQLLPSATLQIGNYDNYTISNEDLEELTLTLPAGLQNRTGGLQPRIALRIQL